MKHHSLSQTGVLLLAALFASLSASAVVFTNNAVIGISNTNYDAGDIIVSNCTLTINGPHNFASVLIAASGKLTHSSDGTGQTTETLSVTNEPHVLIDINPVPLVNSNVVLASVAVWDAGSTVLYTNDVDYTLSVDGNGFTQLARTTNSTIPDGTNVLVSYNWQAGPVASSVNLLVSGDVMVAAGGLIDAFGHGYSSVSATGRGGSAGSPSSGAGGGNGGLGGISSSNGVSGASLGQYFSPTSPGGAGGTGAGGSGATGGGLVTIQCDGTFTLDGSINVSGMNATNSRGGGGAGGSVWIVTTNFSGGGSIIANGGAGEPIHGGGGGGGRIALEYYAKNTFAGSMTALGGAGWQAGGAGTVFVRQVGTIGQLTLDNLGLSGAGSPVTINNGYVNLTVQGKAAMLLANGATVGELLVRSNSSIVSLSSNNATLSLTVMTNATIEATAQLSMSGRGYFRGTGINLGSIYSTFGGGGGHGGYGGRLAFGTITNATGGGVYDSVTAPAQSGSGASGSFTANGSGGGIIRLMVANVLRLDGELRADATGGTSDLASGGAGGSIWVTTGTLAGNGRLTADGGAGGMNYAGGGAGGRIAVYYTSNSFTGTFSAHGGNAGNPGGAGTVYTKPSTANGNLTVDNGGPRGANTLLELSTVAALNVANGAVLSNSSPSPTIGSFTVGTNAVFAFSYFSSSSINMTGNVTVAAGGTISIDGAGSSSSPLGSGGGGHAGVGGRGSTSGGTGVLDVASSPTQSGGSGGYGSGFVGARGGGAWTLTTSGLLQLDGKITANGLDAATNNAGGGAGGSLRVTVGRLSGSGMFAADGGSGFLPNGGGGGGGCVAVTCTTTINTFTGSFSAKGGNGYQRGGAGTIFYKRTSSIIYPSIIVDNGGFSGTNTLLNAIGGFNAVDLTVQGGGMVSSWTGPSLANLIVRSNSWFGANATLTVISNVMVEAGGGIRLDGIGTSSSGTGNSSTRGGAGHGGYGGGNASPTGVFGNVYDSITTPNSQGSVGGHPNGPSFGARGGGFMQLTVQGLLQLDGRISADGWDGEVGTGGGSGGGLRLILNKFAGNGSITANGGAGLPSAGLGGGGGGGRIAVTWNPTSFGNISSNLFTGTYSARGGNGVVPGGAGTIYLKRNDQSFSTVIVDNGGLTGPASTPLGSAYSAPTVNWNLSVIGGSAAYPSSTLSGVSNLLVGAGSQFTASSSTSLSLSVLDKVTIAAGGAINADGKGFARAAGPGAGASIASKGAGGGYGGVGGASSSNAKGGTNYGSATQPVDLGSGGGIGANAYINGCEGGGAIKLIVPGTLTIAGTLSANGNTGFQDDSGGGAGGSIWVTAKTIAGAGVIAADGGDGDFYGGGGAGGGRIALYAKSTNGFTGVVSTLGGDGANAGQDGTIVFTTNMLPFSITSSSPGGGGLATTVNAVTFTFSQNVNPATVSPALFTLTMPSNYAGPLPVLTASASGNTVTLNATPALNVPGNYSIVAAPGFVDIFGTPMSGPYTNYLSLSPPTIEGLVRDTNNTGVAGVTIQTPGYLPTSTDANGYYVLGVPFGWTGAITPSLGANMFVPGSITLANITAQTTDQNFLMVPTILPIVSSGVSGTNLLFNWSGFSNVTYQVYSSSNLVDWVPWGGPLPGTNAPMQLQIPVGTDAQSYFRLGASN